MTQILNLSNVAAWLVARGLIAGDAPPQVADVGRTHRVFRVEAGSLTLFVKQPGATLASAYAACRQEAALYGLAAHDETLRRLTPRLSHHDARLGLVVTQGQPGAVSFAHFVREEGRAPENFEERLAEAMARLHARPFDLAAAGFDAHRRSPVTLTLGHARPDVWTRFGPIGPQVAALLRRRPHLARLFNEAQNDWRADTLIHCDPGFENIVLHPRGAASPWLYLVDWEMAGLGDAAWDLATLLRPALTATLAPQAFYADFGALRPPGPPAPTLAPAARFWRAYAQTRGWREARRREELLRSVRLAGLQIAWSIIDASRRSPRFDVAAIHAVERALGLALEPAAAMRLFEDA